MSQPHAALRPPLPPLGQSPKINTFRQLIDLVEKECNPHMHPDLPQQWLQPLLNGLSSYPFEQCKPAQSDALAQQEAYVEKELLESSSFATDNTRQRSLVLLYILCRRFSCFKPSTANWPPCLLQICRQLVSHGNHQDFRDHPDKAEELVRGLYDFGDIYKAAQLVSPIISDLLEIVSMGGTRFTTIHPIFIEQCLYHGNGRDSERALKHDFLDIPHYITHVQFLSYHYLGAMLWLVYGRYEEAMRMLEITATAPGGAASAIQVAAHKKLTLVNLMLNGETFQYPRYLSQAVQRAIKSHAAPYTDLAAAFSQLDAKKVNEIATQGAEIWSGDGNTGLVTLVLRSLPERKLLSLKKIYLKLSLADTADKVQVGEKMQESEVHGMILSMIERRMLHASITPASDKTPAYLTFLDDAEQHNTPETMQKLDMLIRQANQSAARFASHDRHLAMYPKWMKQGVRAEQPVASDSGTFQEGRVPMKGVGADWTDMGF